MCALTSRKPNSAKVPVPAEAGPLPLSPRVSTEPCVRCSRRCYCR